MSSQSGRMIAIGIAVLAVLLVQPAFLSNPFPLTSKALADPEPFKSFPEIQASDRIIIFAPHPDDESLGNTGIIRAALRNGAPILVVIMTNGDAYEHAFLQDFLRHRNMMSFSGNIGEMRHLETINAMERLGLTDKDLIFLGYPDGGLKRLFEDYWDDGKLFKMTRGLNPFGPHVIGSNTFDHSPYSFAYEKNAAYTGSNVARNLHQIMSDFKPTMIFYPDDGDDHPDHWATSAFVRYVALEVGFNGKTYCYLVHKGSSWPTPLSYRPDDELLPPPDIMELDAEWFKLPLSKQDQELKDQAVNSHITQITSMKDLLQSFVRTNEIFSDYPMIAVEKTNNASAAEFKMPVSSFKDLRNDAKTGNLQRSDDLTSCGFVYDKNYAYMYLSSTDIQTELVYDFHLRIFDGISYKRVDVIIENGTARYELKASNSVKSDQAPGFRFDREAETMVVTLPINLFAGAKYLLMSTDVRLSSGHYIDVMSMRVFRFDDKI